MPQKPKTLDDSTSMRAWFGVELRNWRVTRGLSSTALGQLVHVSGSTVERIEKNERPCDAELAARFDAALTAGGALIRLWRRVEDDDRRRADADTASERHSLNVSSFHKQGLGATPGTTTHPLERRSFLAAGGLAALDPAHFADLVPRKGTSSVPAVVRAEDIEQIWAASKVFAEWDHLYGGGGLVREASIGHFNWAKSLLTTKCPEPLVEQLHTAVGRFAVALGASAFDAYEHEDAALLLEFATACAEAADNWHLRAVALNKRARHAIWCGAPDVGLAHVENGLLSEDRLTHREQAMLYNARARAWAKMGRQQEALAAVGRSDETFARAKDGEDGPWMDYYDHAQHYGDTGHALADLATAPGRSAHAAADRLKVAIDSHTDAYVRSRVLSGTKLATLIFTTGDPYEAAHVAGRALDGIGRLRSQRAVTDVRTLADATTPYRLLPEVAALRTRITTVVNA